jgi:isocitrate dehydrogenase
MNVHVSASNAASMATRTPTPITVAYGDGIGPEIMKASLKVLDAAGAALAPEPIEIGEQVYLKGNERRASRTARGSPCAGRKSSTRRRSPRPRAAAIKSLNVTVRKSLGMFANVRPCAALSPFVATKPSRHGRGDRARERGRPLCRHRAPPDR